MPGQAPDSGVKKGPALPQHLIGKGETNIRHRDFMEMD